MLPLLGKAGVVDDENALRRREGLGHGTLADELMKGLIEIRDFKIGGRTTLRESGSMLLRSRSRIRP